MKEKNIQLIGGILALIGAILGLVLHPLFFNSWYDALINAEKTLFPSLTNWKIVTYMLPVFTDFGILAGILYAISTYGFYKKSSWAYSVSVVANVLALQFSFWPMIPALDIGVTPIYMFIFLPNVLIYLVLHIVIGKRSAGQVIVGLFAGMTLVTGFINGTACLNLIWMKGDAFYVLANRMHWIVAISFAVITVGIMLIPKKEWVRMLGFGMAILEIALGTPMGIKTTIEKGEFSMFLAGPILSLLLLVLFIWPKMWNKVLELDKHKEEVSWMIYKKITV